VSSAAEQEDRMHVVNAIVVASEEAAAEGTHVSPFAFGAFAFVALVALLIVTMMIKVGD
jgi:hypothetical protein